MPGRHNEGYNYESKPLPYQPDQYWASSLPDYEPSSWNDNKAVGWKCSRCGTKNLLDMERCTQINCPGTKSESQVINKWWVEIGDDDDNIHVPSRRMWERNGGWQGHLNENSRR
ncbi:hypothetical protein QBC38DRAFT_449352 [Podospora fimiseda]|uniref:Uncharacterized protein n=1 Tax=Podospora fimiseda TaxID=252190 RepID=A0AAN6YM11_9PEZI|nr:hypothetical protein QBC38DRAFT_449352 [Podospora fimiseda]